MLNPEIATCTSKNFSQGCDESIIWSMSRSHRKTPICGMTTAESEGKDKDIWHRRFRRTVRQEIQAGSDQDDLAHFREASDPWSFDKDGKQRFDPKRLPKEMRK
jgi:hypothetical protein